MTLKTRFLLLLPVMLFVAASGCSSTKRMGASVHGKVTYKGQTVGGGTVSFYPKTQDEGGGFGCPIKADGTYEAPSMPAGEYEVAIETESNNPDRKTPTYGPKGPGGGDKKQQGGQDFYKQKMREMGKAPEATEAKGPYVKIEPKYNDRKKSGLTVTLTNGKNEKNFTLE